MRPCKTSIMWKRRYVSGSTSTVRNKGGKGGHHACMNEHVTASCVIGAESAFSSVIVSVSEKKKREAELSPGPPARFHEWLQQGKLSLIVKLFGRRLFLHHLMLNSSTFLRQFFSFYPSECLQIRFSCQAVSCWGLNDRGRCIIHQNYISWQWSRNRNKVFIGSGITRSNMWRGAVILRALLVWSLGNWWSLFF